VARHLPGVIARHSGKAEDSVSSLQAAKNAHAESQLGAYVIFDETGDAVGMASVMPDLTLREQRWSISPALARFGLSKAVRVSGPDVTAWTAGPIHFTTAKDNPLQSAYVDLIATGEAERVYRDYHATKIEEVDLTKIKPWTIEPVAVPRLVHNAILSAGFQSAGDGIFDDQESRKLAPPVSTLYVAPVRSLKVT
jgi:hypothetical protein